MKQWLLLFHWTYAFGRGRLVPGQIEPRLERITRRRISLGIVFYAMATLLAFVNPMISMTLFVLLPFFYMRSSEIDKFLKSQHSE